MTIEMYIRELNNNARNIDFANKAKDMKKHAYFMAVNRLIMSKLSALKGWGQCARYNFENKLWLNKAKFL